MIPRADDRKERPMEQLAEPKSPTAEHHAPVGDAVRVQILATEHWSLLATRSMTWNEVFTRAGMFLTMLSAAVVALALVAQATNFGPNFRLFALLVLPVVLFVGIATHIRLDDARGDDLWHVIGMNRLRHAYLELAPDLEPYFVTSHHDDLAGIMQTYGPDARLRPSRFLASTPAFVGVINGMVAGVLGALVVDMLGGTPTMYVAAGVLTAIALMVLLNGVLPYRDLTRRQRDYRPRFPR
jgi:membrane protein implicated in regulation of membrane protease activity